jgi:hypothetical protein
VSDEYKDLFPEDDELNLEEPQFPDEVSDDFGDLPPVQDGQVGSSSMFMILVAGLAVVFVILVAVFAAIVIRRDESCNENCRLATEISATNAQVIADTNASQTAIAIANTAAAETQVAVQATSTQVAAEQATATQQQVNTAVAATETQVSVDATATQVNFERGATQTAIANFTDTPTPTVESTEDTSITEGVGGGTGDTTPSTQVQPASPTTDTSTTLAGFSGQVNLPANLQGQSLTVCIFLDDGDGVFDPSSDVSDPNCAPPAETTAVETEEVTEGGGVAVTPAPAASDTPAVAAVTPTTAAPPLNPIFATATAAAQATANAAGGGVSGPPSPTPEGSSFNPALYLPIGRSKLEPVQGMVAQQQDGDSLIDSVTIDAQGRFILPDLPPGNYWIAVGDVRLQINVTDTVGEQVFTFPREDDVPIVIVVSGVGVGGPTPSVEAGPTLSDIFKTATAVAGGGIPSPTPPSVVGVGGATVTPSMPTTGLFTGEGDDVTTADLLILATIGAVLIGVVFAARRMRSTA